jgi:hypothetical protein
MIADKINEYLVKTNKTITQIALDEFADSCKRSMERQLSQREDDANLRMSSCGKCARALAYKYHGVPGYGKELDARSLLNFLFGDIMEAAIVTVANLAGCDIRYTGKNQKDISIEIDGVTVTGHPDGIKDDVLFECKSMNDRAFKDFENEQIDESYLAQANMYMGVIGLKRCCFVAVNKNVSVVKEVIVSFDKKIFDSAYMNLKKVVSSKSELPEPAYSILDSGFYPWQCLYCEHWKLCRPNAARVLVGKAYRLKEIKCHTAPVTTSTKE